MSGDLHTTNLFLGIIATVSAVELLAVLVVCGAAVFVCYRLLQVIRDIEERHVAPAAARVHGILDDVREVTSGIKTQTEHVKSAAGWILSVLGRRGDDNAKDRR